MRKSRAKTRPAKGAKKKRFTFAILQRPDPWLLGGMTALFVGRPLLASEGVAWLGDGLPWVMLWFVLAAIVCLLAARRGRLATPLAGLDGLVLLLVLWHTLAALVSLRTGSPRPAVNMLGEWAGMGLSFFCARQLIRGQDEARGLAAVMIALAVGLSTLGYEQFFVQMPDARAEFTHNPDAMLKSAGWDFVAGSPERKQFQDRLESPEPMATFALTNSFAGLLVPWLVVAVGVLASAARAGVGRRASRGLVWRAGIVAGAIFGCLLLTKCRSGWIGLAAALMGMMAIGWRKIGSHQNGLAGPLQLWRGILTQRKLLAVVGAASAVVIIVVVVARSFDRNLFAEAKRSLGFRLEYWQASWAMIREHPWFGCGPGNFQDFYTAYKMPAASEEIRDPHNFVVELAATAGVPAALAMLGVLGVFLLQLVRALGWNALCATAGLSSSAEAARRSTALLDKPAVAHGAHKPAVAHRAADAVVSSTATAILSIAVGGVCGLLLAELIGSLDIVPLGFQRLAIIAGGGVAAWLLLRPWTLAGRVRPGWLAMAVVGQSVHLLAAGGIGFPGVSGSLWLLLAMGSRLIEADAAEPTAFQPEATARPLSGRAARIASWWRFEPIGLLTVIVCGGFGCFIAGYRPVLERNTLMQRAEDEDVLDANREDQRRNLLLQAALADSLSDEPPRALAQQSGASLLNHYADDTKRQFDGAVDVMLRLRPRSSSAHLEAAQWYAELYKRRHNRSDADRAERLADDAVRLYPNSASTRAVAAEIHALADHQEQASREANEAIRLDAITPHADKKLAPAARARMQELARPAASALPLTNARRARLQELSARAH